MNAPHLDCLVVEKIVKKKKKVRHNPHGILGWKVRPISQVLISASDPPSSSKKMMSRTMSTSPFFFSFQNFLISSTWINYKLITKESLDRNYFKIILTLKEHGYKIIIIMSLLFKKTPNDNELSCHSTIGYTSIKRKTD